MKNFAAQQQDLQNLFLNGIADAEKALSFMRRPESVRFFGEVTEEILKTFQRGGKLLIAGNGGSLCDAMHFAEELTGFFRSNRKPLAAIALADPGHMSCVSNDAGFEFVFSRQVEALGKQGDLLVLLSTSGNSKNLIQAADAAEEMGISVIGFLGKGGGELKHRCSPCWVVEGFEYSDRIQEAHMASIHMIIEAVEVSLFGCPKKKVAPGTPE